MSVVPYESRQMGLGLRADPEPAWVSEERQT